MTYGYALIALADPTRRCVFEHIVAGPKSVCAIAALMPISRPAVSQHLAQLKLGRLVSETPSGVRRIYAVDPAGVEALRGYLDRVWDDALLNLKALSEALHDRNTDD
jgi:DNA-binding transcriptional ArsR family regulator